jgi:hypothetical protein
MTNPEDMLADTSEIKKAIKSLRKKHHIEGLIRRGIAPKESKGSLGMPKRLRKRLP